MDYTLSNVIVYSLVPGWSPAMYEKGLNGRTHQQTHFFISKKLKITKNNNNKVSGNRWQGEWQWLQILKKMTERPSESHGKLSLEEEILVQFFSCV